jgi:glycosyltransferase involved in cell wall biosynthesis
MIGRACFWGDTGSGAECPRVTLQIAFNAQRLAEQRLGVGRYIEYHLRYWQEMLAADERVTVFLRRPLSAGAAAYLRLPASMPVQVLPPDVPGIPWENVSLRWPAMRHDVLFCPAYTAPIGYRGRLVVATHSVNNIHPGAHGWSYQFTHAWLNRHSARRADAVIAASESARDVIADVWRIPTERISVVLQGADDCFVPTRDETTRAAVRTRFFGRDRPYVLFVGKASTRRNIPMLLRAFAKVRREQRIPHGLLLFGPNPDGLPLQRDCEELGITGDVVQTDGIVDDHSELVPVYGSADLFVHPSEFEGWSMTTVEAMSCGVAVIATNRGGLGELAHGHALTLDKPTVDSLADAIARVLGDDALRLELQQKALARGSALRWRATTRQTLDVLRRVAAH